MIDIPISTATTITTTTAAMTSAVDSDLIDPIELLLIRVSECQLETILLLIELDSLLNDGVIY